MRLDVELTEDDAKLLEAILLRQRRNLDELKNLLWELQTLLEEERRIVGPDPDRDDRLRDEAWDWGQP